MPSHSSGQTSQGTSRSLSRQATYSEAQSHELRSVISMQFLVVWGRRMLSHPMALPKGCVGHISEAGTSQHPSLGTCPPVGSGSVAEGVPAVADAQAVSSEQENRGRESRSRNGSRSMVARHGGLTVQMCNKISSPWRLSIYW